METKIYTMQDWENDKTFSAKVGQRVSFEVFCEMRDCVPPAYLSHNLMQVGEPYGTDKETHRDLFTTFVRDDAGAWVYAGNCLYGKTENRELLY